LTNYSRLWLVNFIRSVLFSWTGCTSSQFIFLPLHLKKKDEHWTNAAISAKKNKPIDARDTRDHQLVLVLTFDEQQGWNNFKNVASVMRNAIYEYQFGLPDQSDQSDQHWSWSRWRLLETAESRFGKTLFQSYRKF